MCDDSGGESENEAFIEQDTNSNIDEMIIDDTGALINDDIEEKPSKRTKLQLDNFTWQKSHNPTVLPEQPVPYGEIKIPQLTSNEIDPLFVFEVVYNLYSLFSLIVTESELYVQQAGKLFCTEQRQIRVLFFGDKFYYGLP